MSEPNLFPELCLSTLLLCHKQDELLPKPFNSKKSINISYTIQYHKEDYGNKTLKESLQISAEAEKESS